MSEQNQNINVRISGDHKRWLEATSAANKNCGISNVIRSLIQAEIENEERHLHATNVVVEHEQEG